MRHPVERSGPRPRLVPHLQMHVVQHAGHLDLEQPGALCCAVCCLPPVVCRLRPSCTLHKQARRGALTAAVQRCSLVANTLPYRRAGHQLSGMQAPVHAPSTGKNAPRSNLSVSFVSAGAEWVLQHLPRQALSPRLHLFFSVHTEPHACDLSISHPPRRPKLKCAGAAQLLQR